MVSATLVDTLVSPSRSLKDLFVKAIAEGKLDEFPNIVREHFVSLFAGDALDQVPLLDTAHPPAVYAPMSLVRFRAMVQDTSCSSEMYLSSPQHSICGGWGLESEEDPPANLNISTNFGSLRERDVIWAVSIPGAAHWCAPSSSDLLPTVDDSGSSVPNKVASHSISHKYPIPDSAYIAAQVKVYDDSAGSLRPTGLHDFVGILTFESVQSDFETEEAAAPTLHVLFHRQLPKTITLAPPMLPEGFQARIVRDALIDWICTETLGGDHDAAEWVMLSCLSSVESRNPPLFPLAVTLSGFTRHESGSTPSLSHILSEILPLYTLLPLSLRLLNEGNFLPESKDEDLHAGILQVPHDTTIVITETGIMEGSLVEKGIENAQALQEVAKLQTLPYKFPFSQFFFPTDISFIVLTDGKKSLFLDSSVVVPVRLQASSDLYKGKDSIKWPTPETLDSFREYVLRAKTCKVTVGGQLSEHIKNDFVQERQENKSITPDDLVRNMTLARLTARSRLESEMSMDSWSTAKALDNRRKARNL